MRANAAGLKLWSWGKLINFGNEKVKVKISLWLRKCSHTDVGELLRQASNNWIMGKIYVHLDKMKAKWNMWKHNAATSQVFADCFDCRTHIWISFVPDWEVLWRALRIWRPSPQTPFKRNFYSHQTFLITIIIINIFCPKAFEKKFLFIETLHYPFTFLYSPSFSFQTWKWRFYPHIEFSPPDICDVEKSFSYSSPPNYPTVDRLQFPF